MNEIILLIPNNIKTDIIKKVRKDNPCLNIKFMSIEEFINKYTFTYDNKTIYYLMKKYSLKYSSALIYLDNLCYLSDKLSNNKMNKLKEIKLFLDENNLLIYDKKFLKYVQNKDIYIYGYNYLTRYQKKVLSNLNYHFLEKEYQKYNNYDVYYADNINDEVIFVANRIIGLLKQGIDIKNIKLMNVTSEYKEVITRIFNLYNIPINIKKNSIYSSNITKIVLDNLNDLDSIKDKINLNNINNLEIYNKIIDVLNSFSFANNKEDVRDLITIKLKDTYIDNKFTNEIGIIKTSYQIKEEDYVFLMGYNKENIPLLYKDNDYFSDSEKELLDIDTSLFLNKLEKDSTIKSILAIKNLTITSKLSDNTNNYTISNLLDNINLIKIDNNNYSNSLIMNKIILTKKLDNLVKYNIKENDLDLLYYNYSNIPYLKYNNSYNKIDEAKLKKYLNNKLLLSYSALDNYSRCKFKFYLNNILKINIIKDDFAIIVGNVCHYVLSNIDKKDFDPEKYFDDYLSNVRNFSNKEKFFLQNIKEEMLFVIETIKKQLTYTTFDKKMYEQKVYINKDRDIKVTFMGVIDKVLYKEENGITYLVVIDYKTGNTNIKLDNIEYGIDMQLPIYLYLSSNMNLKNIQIVGFYLQKLLNTNLDNTKDYLEAKENNLKLEGYSIKNEQILSMFDNTYENSKLIKSMKTTSNGFYNYAKVLEKDEIDCLIDKTSTIIDKAIDNILKGDFTIDPKVIDNENVSCKFCDYQYICYRKEEDTIFINREEK